MLMLSPRAAFLSAMLLLSGGAASALTCVDDPDRTNMLAQQAEAIVIARVAHIPAAAPAAAPAPTDDIAPSAILSTFGAPPVVRELEVEAIATFTGEVPEGVFIARFLEGPCAPMPVEGEKRTLFLVHDDAGWRVLGSD